MKKEVLYTYVRMVVLEKILNESIETVVAIHDEGQAPSTGTRTTGPISFFIHMM